jgi:hypothetical protein
MSGAPGGGEPLNMHVVFAGSLPATKGSTR